MVDHSFNGNFRDWEEYFKYILYKFFAIISFPLLHSSCFNFCVHFRSICLTPFTQMSSLNRYEKVTCENCGTQTTKLNLARHNKSCYAGTLYCTQCPNLSTTSQNDLKYHIAKKHSTPKLDVTFKCKLCHQSFHGFILEGIKNFRNEAISPYEWLDHPDKMKNTELPPYDAFYSKLRSCNPLEAEYTDYVNLLKSGLITEQAVVKLKLSNPPPTGIENYQYLQQIWKQEQMSSFKDSLRWYNNKDVVPTLEAIQKMIVFIMAKILIC